MPRLSASLVTFAVVFLYTLISAANCRTAVGDAFSLQTKVRPTAETQAPESSAARSLFTGDLLLVGQPATGQPRERLRDRIRERLEERRKAASESSSDFAPGLQALPNPGGGAVYPGLQPPGEPRPLLERFRRMLGDMGLSLGSEGPRGPSPDWAYGTPHELHPAQPGPMVHPNFPAMPAPQPVQPAPPGPWLRSPDNGRAVSTPQGVPAAEESPPVPQESPTAPTAPALPLLVPPDMPVPSAPSTEAGPTPSQVPIDMPAEEKHTDASGDDRESARSKGDAAENSAATSAGTGTFGQLLGGVSRFFGGNAPSRGTGQAAPGAESGRLDATGNRSSPNSPSSSAENVPSDAASTSSGGASKPNLEDIRKKVLRRSAKSD